jgi:hypothetical protein
MRQESFTTTKSLESQVTACQRAIQNGEIVTANELLATCYAQLEKLGDISPQPDRPASIANLLEMLVTIHALIDFFSTGRLVRRASLRPCFDDSEYIGGVISFAMDIYDYCLGRAMLGDVASLVIARDVVDSLNFCLVAFNFRNGPLRRKFDGMKYALKRLEDLLFEQSLVTGDEVTLKRGEGDDELVDTSEFEVMRASFEEVSAPSRPLNEDKSSCLRVMAVS